jgi:cytidyltransferase-like protein
MKARQVVITGAFDDLQAQQVRFLEEAAKLGDVTVLLWSDELVSRFMGRPPKFQEAERRYCLEAVRFVKAVQPVGRQASIEALPEISGPKPDAWVVQQAEHSSARIAFCGSHGLEYHAITDDQLAGFPEASPGPVEAQAGRKKVVVTGCFDWFHSGHVRFCEEVSGHGDLYVIVGSDVNVRLLKGGGHPLFPEEQRRYVAGSIRFVKQALVSTGSGWLDADPEIRQLKPDIFAVNEDGDKGGKREYCEKLGIEYLVLKRTPAPGLPGRTSTDLRGF